MKILVRFHGLQASSALGEHARRRASARLGRFRDQLSRVVIRLGDVNGPRGGVDKRCQIEVQGRRIEPAALEQMSSDPYTAVDRALERVARSVGRRLSRSRARRGSGPRITETLKKELES